MALIRLTPVPDHLLVQVDDVPAFPAESFRLAYPEAIGDVASPVHEQSLSWTWQLLPGGALHCAATAPRELRLEMVFTPGDDFVDVEFAVKNSSTRSWQQGMAFNCFQCGQTPSIRDHDCLRHWVRSADGFRRLVEVHRVFGPRPTIQLYNVEGAPPVKDMPFPAGFNSTSKSLLEPWMAIVSRSAQRLVATVAKPAAFLFQNQEYSCIHAATGFGPIVPGQTATGSNRVYFVEASLSDWHARMLQDMA